MTDLWHAKINRLFKKAAAGNIAVRGKLYEETAMHLLYFARSVCQDKVLCEDAVEETFVEIFKGGGSYDFNKNAYPWMVGILRNKLKQLSLQQPLLLSAEEELDNAVCTTTDETENDVRAAIAQLNKEDRYFVIGYYFFGYTLAELAQPRGISVATAGRRLKAAEEQLRKLLK